jgi:hypothetical protein
MTETARAAIGSSLQTMCRLKVFVYVANEEERPGSIELVGQL